MSGMAAAVEAKEHLLMAEAKVSWELVAWLLPVAALPAHVL